MDDLTSESESAEIDPYLKEQNEGIFYAFAKEDHQVLTTPEIVEHVDLSRRQVERRLKNLRDQGIVGTRKPGRTRLWWLETEVEEPVSVQYPIFKLIQQRLSLQLVVIGILLGVVTVISSTTAVLVANYGFSPYLVDTESLLHATLLFSMTAVLFLLTGGLIAGTVWLFDHLGIEIRYNPDDSQ